jgi:hypothetical protein
MLGGPAGELAHVVGHAQHLGKLFLAAGAATMAVKLGWEAIEQINERNVEHAKEYTKALQEQAKVIREAKEGAEKRALGVVESQGGNLRALVGMGKLDEANALTKEFGAEEAQKAVLEAHRLFGDDHQASAALTAAARASKITGVGLVESVKAAQDVNLGNQDQAVAGLVSEARNRTVSTAEVHRAEQAIEATPLTQQIEAVHRVLGQRDLAMQQSIVGGDAQVAARRDLTEALLPVTVALAQQYRVQQDQLEVMRAGLDASNKLVDILTGQKPLTAYQSQAETMAGM